MADVPEVAQVGSGQRQVGAYPELDVVMRAARVFSGIVAASLAHVGDIVTPPQLRALVLIGTRRNINASAVADALEVHLSSASRLIDRLVTTGLVERRESPVDRRHMQLSLTDAGSRLLNQIMEHRRSMLAAILARMSAADRRAIQQCLTRFSEAAGEPEEPAWGQL
ncbi:MAG: MarR family transcriptional regulator [Dermatophilaceae bacterium]